MNITMKLEMTHFECDIDICIIKKFYISNDNNY